jgi:hypothetical protein
MKIHTFLLSLFVIILAGCAGSPARLAMMSPEQLQTQSDGQLCAAYGFAHSKKVRAEIERRGILTAEEWLLVERREVAIGMSELAMVASIGGPNGLYGSVNETVTAGGVRRQYVYRDTEYGRAGYVYTEGGRVTAYQR